MRTSNPFSAIAYVKDFDLFKSTLDDLCNSGKLSLYAYIFHKGETDEFGETDKDHCHVLFVPYDTIDTRLVDDYICERQGGRIFYKFDKCRSCGDWVYYAYHDAVYLATKGETRQFAYKFDDIITNDRNALVRYRRDIKLQYKADVATARALIAAGFSTADIMAMCNVNGSQYNGAKAMVNDIRAERIRETTSRVCAIGNAFDITEQIDTDDMPF